MVGGSELRDIRLQKSQKLQNQNQSTSYNETRTVIFRILGLQMGRLLIAVTVAVKSSALDVLLFRLDPHQVNVLKINAPNKGIN